MLDADAPLWLKSLAGQAEAYVFDLLGVRLKLVRRRDMESFPRFLTDQFEFVQGKLLDTDLLFMAQPPKRQNTPANVARLWREADKRSPMPVVYLAGAVTGFNRKRLLEQRTPFLAPKSQLFLPGLFVDLRDNFRAPRGQVEVERISPAAQKVVLAGLLGIEVEGVSASVLARRMKYSAMTLSRAMDDLRAAGLAEIEEAGKERQIAFVSHKAQLWRDALPLLRNPVRKRRRLRRLHDHGPGLVAGESALAHFTMLSEPRMPAVALAASTWLRFEEDFGEPVDPWDENGVIVETWSYDPELLGAHGYVDRFSLYLSLRDNGDERVTLALDELLEAALHEGA
jgi:DNA-binding transcriptional ArsR family regulator